MEKPAPKDAMTKTLSTDEQYLKDYRVTLITRLSNIHTEIAAREKIIRAAIGDATADLVQEKKQILLELGIPPYDTRTIP